jgi:hypothetical protein
MLGTTTDLSVEDELYFYKVPLPPPYRNGMNGITEPFLIIQSIHWYMIEFAAVLVLTQYNKNVKQTFGYVDLMFCWPCIIVYRYSETKVMHFLFNLLRIEGLYMCQALLAHAQEALHKQHLAYCVCVTSLGCTRIGLELVQPTDVTRMQHTMLETCRGP